MKRLLGFFDEAGNAIVEFLVAGVALQLMLLALVGSLARQVDSQTAADLLARQGIRAVQLEITSANRDAQFAAVLSSFGLVAGDFSIVQTGSCPGLISVTATVRRAQAVVKATCD